VLLGIGPTTAAQRHFLTLFGAKRFVPTQPSNYAQIEEVAVREAVVVGVVGAGGLGLLPRQQLTGSDYAAMSRR
jgi:ABC-type phosphate/phosphonate transport system permease subunit